MIFQILINACDAVYKYLGTVPGSLKYHLNTEELLRITLTALTAGGGLFGLLQALVLGAGSIFPMPTDAALAATILTTIMEVIRRLSHGTEVPANPLKRTPSR